MVPCSQPRTGERSQETSSLPRASDMPHFQFGIFTESNRGGKEVCWHSIFMPQWSWQEPPRPLDSKGFHLKLQGYFNNGPTSICLSHPRTKIQTSPNLAPQISTRRTKFRGQYISGESEEGRRADSPLHPAGRASKGH